MLKILIIALLFTGLVQADQLSESGFLHYLKDSFARNDDDINERLIGECALFLSTFPQSADAPDVLFIRARIHDQEKQYMRAVINYLQLLRLYPEAEITGEAQAALRLILQEKDSRTFRDYVQRIDDYLAEKPPATSLSGRFYNFLAFLHELGHPGIDPYLIEQMIFYIHTFDQDVRNPDQILLWTAGLYQKERDWLEAMMAYDKLIYLKPESALVPEVIFSLGMLQYTEMRRYNEARDNFIRLITDYPEKEITGDAQFFLGELYQRRLDDTDEALTNYRLLIEAYPENKYAVEALRRIAEIHYDADRYEKAISVYEEIYDDYRTAPFAPEALKEIETIYRRKFNDYARAAETLQKYADTYPEREDAPEIYYDAAEMYLEELNNREKALELLRVIIEKYPQSRYAEKAKNDIAELSGRN